MYTDIVDRAIVPKIFKNGIENNKHKECTNLKQGPLNDFDVFPSKRFANKNSHDWLRPFRAKVDGSN